MSSKIIPMGDVTIGGSVGGDVAAGDLTKTGQFGGPGDGGKWMLALVIVVVVIALAWGANRFVFRGLGVQGDSTEQTPR